jgi:hypothetical protein
VAESTLPKSKKCPRCGQTKDATAFGTRKFEGRIYLKSKCRSCEADYAKELRLDPRIAELSREVTRRWRTKQKDDPEYRAAKKASEKQDYARHGKRRAKALRSKPEFRAKDNKRSREWRAKNKGRTLTPQQKAKLKASRRKSNLKKQLDADWVAADRARNKAWVLNNQDRARLYKSAYKSRRRANGGDLPSIRHNFLACLESYRIGAQYWDVYESCLIDHPSIDHVVPIKSGGTNDVDNLCVTSLSNNSAKRELSLLMYLWKRAIQSQLRRS